MAFEDLFHSLQAHTCDGSSLVEREFLIGAIAVDSDRDAQIRPVREQVAQCILDHLLLVLIEPGIYQVLGLNQLLAHFGLRKGDSVQLRRVYCTARQSQSQLQRQSFAVSGSAGKRPSTMHALTTNGLCRFCPLLPSLFALSRGDRDRVGDLGPGSDPGARDRASQRVVRGVSGQGFGLRRVRGLYGALPV